MFSFLIFEKEQRQSDYLHLGSSILLLPYYQQIFIKIPISWTAYLQNT